MQRLSADMGGACGPRPPHHNAVSLEDEWQAHAEGSCLNDITYRHLLPTCFIPTCRRHSASCGSSSPAAVRPRPRGRGSLLVPRFAFGKTGAPNNSNRTALPKANPIWSWTTASCGCMTRTCGIVTSKRYHTISSRSLWTICGSRLNQPACRRAKAWVSYFSCWTHSANSVLPTK